MQPFASEEAEATADMVRRFCDRALGETLHESALVPLDASLWQALGETGVLALSPGLGTGETMLAAAALFALGRSAFPGPAPATLLATALVGDDLAAALSEGTSIVSLGSGAAMPWAILASVFIAIEGDDAVLVEGRVGEPIATLGGENWARMDVTHRTALGSWRPHTTRYDLPLAAYLVGAAGRLLDETAAYAAERRQFGKPIGDFQGVALPLAAVSTRIDATRTMIERTAERLDAGAGDAEALTAAVRRLASLAARDVIHVAHQTFGAFGTIKDGPVFAMSRRLQQWMHQQPTTALPDALIGLASQSSLLFLIPPAQA